MYFITRHGKEMLLMLCFEGGIRVNTDITDDNVTVSIHIKSLDETFSHTEKFDPVDKIGVQAADTKAFHQCFHKIAEKHMKHILVKIPY